MKVVKFSWPEKLGEVQVGRLLFEKKGPTLELLEEHAEAYRSALLSAGFKELGPQESAKPKGE
ncbi:hypothetical protein KJZ99_00090 [bacterium]|nr:hypothetical protein [bacterium]